MEYPFNGGAVGRGLLLIAGGELRVGRALIQPLLAGVVLALLRVLQSRELVAIGLPATGTPASAETCHHGKQGAADQKLRGNEVHTFFPVKQ